MYKFQIRDCTTKKYIFIKIKNKKKNQTTYSYSTRIFYNNIITKQYDTKGTLIIIKNKNYVVLNLSLLISVCFVYIIYMRPQFLIMLFTVPLPVRTLLHI